MTIEELENRVETELFSQYPKTDFERRCRAREVAIKKYIEVCRVILMQYVEKPGLDPDNLSYWKKEKIKKNMANLVKYTLELANDLDKNKIELLCKKTINTPIAFSTFQPDIIFIVQNSYYGSIITDILWARDVSVREALDISAGKLDLNELGKKLPNKIIESKKDILPYLQKSDKYLRHAPTIKEALDCYNKKLYKGCNLLLMTAIEGIVRDLAKYLNQKQGLELDLDSKKFNSLDALLRLGDWKEDYVIDPTLLSLIVGEHKTATERTSNEKYDPFKPIKINLKTRLDFLRRRFKDDRDLILHGVNHDYGSNWNLFLNFSALSNVHEVTKYYDKLYK